MKFEKTTFNGLIIIEQDIFKDERGYFARAFDTDEFNQAGIDKEFLEDNLSLSKKGSLRGLHFQKAPNEIGKLVRVGKGRILDVVVDIRKGSETFGKWFSIELSAENGKMLYVPEGFAHGFLALEDDTLVEYKYTGHYAPESYTGIKWDDSEIAIDWQFEKYEITEPTITEKDQKLGSLRDYLNIS